MATITLSPIDLRPVAPAARTAPRSTVRLTRRGRAVVFGVGLVTALGLGLGLAANSTATESSESLATITVGPGETLWEIASGVAVEGHTGDMVQQIKELNHLSGGSLQVGQTLRVPAAR